MYGGPDSIYGNWISKAEYNPLPGDRVHVRGHGRAVGTVIARVSTLVGHFVEVEGDPTPTGTFRGHFAPESVTPAVPFVGCPATTRSGSDSYAEFVVWVSPTGREILVSGNPDTKVAPKPPTYLRLSLRKNGRYHVKGSAAVHYSGVSLGRATDYRDPSF